MSQSNEIKRIQIRSFESSKSMISCISFWEGYSRVLIDESVNYSQSLNQNWLLSNSFHGILAEHEGETIGGLLVFYPTEKNKIYPFKETTQGTEANSPFEIETSDGNFAEIFALWHSRKVAGWGLSYILLKAGLALSTKLGFEKTFLLTAKHNIRLAEKAGFEMARTKGFDVFFNFKYEPFGIKAYLYFFDSTDFSFAKKEKEAVAEIAESDFLVKNEKVLSSKLEIEYRLK